MRLRRPPRSPRPSPAPSVLPPPRAYRIRALTFRIHPKIRSVSIYCKRCQESLSSEYPWADAAVLADDCRRHEIDKHSVTVTWAEFCAGGRVSFHDPDWLRRRLTGELDPDTDTGQPPMIVRACAYEWLADSAGPGQVPETVVVRDPVALAEWMGPERAARELAAA